MLSQLFFQPLNTLTKLVRQRVFSPFGVFLCLLTFAPCAAFAESGLAAVLGFSASDAAKQSWADGIAQALSMELQKNGIPLIERKDLALVLNELNLSESGLIENPTLISPKLPHVAYLIKGGFSMLDDSAFVVSAYVVDIQSGLELKRRSVRGNFTIEPMSKSLAALARELIPLAGDAAKSVSQPAKAARKNQPDLEFQQLFSQGLSRVFSDQPHRAVTAFRQARIARPQEASAARWENLSYARLGLDFLVTPSVPQSEPSEPRTPWYDGSPLVMAWIAPELSSSDALIELLKSELKIKFVQPLILGDLAREQDLDLSGFLTAQGAAGGAELPAYAIRINKQQAQELGAELFWIDNPEFRAASTIKFSSDLNLQILSWLNQVSLKKEPEFVFQQAELERICSLNQNADMPESRSGMFLSTLSGERSLGRALIVAACAKSSALDLAEKGIPYRTAGLQETSVYYSKDSLPDDSGRRTAIRQLLESSAERAAKDDHNTRVSGIRANMQQSYLDWMTSPNFLINKLSQSPKSLDRIYARMLAEPETSRQASLLEILDGIAARSAQGDIVVPSLDPQLSQKHLVEAGFSFENLLASFGGVYGQYWPKEFPFSSAQLFAWTVAQLHSGPQKLNSSHLKEALPKIYTALPAPLLALVGAASGDYSVSKKASTEWLAKDSKNPFAVLLRADVIGATEGWQSRAKFLGQEIAKLESGDAGISGAKVNASLQLLHAWALFRAGKSVQVLSALEKLNVASTELKLSVQYYMALIEIAQGKRFEASEKLRNIVEASSGKGIGLVTVPDISLGMIEDPRWPEDLSALSAKVLELLRQAKYVPPDDLGMPGYNAMAFPVMLTFAGVKGFKDSPQGRCFCDGILYKCAME